MLRRTVLGRMWVVGLALMGVALVGGVAQAATLRIDRVDTDDWEEKGTFTFYVDILDDGSEPEEGLDAGSLKLFVEDEEVTGSFKVKTFEEAEKSFSLGMILTGHNQFINVSELKNDDGAVVSIEKKPFEAQKTGYTNLVGELGPNDRVAAWLMTASRFTTIGSFSQNYPRLAKSISKQAPYYDENSGTKSPDLLKALSKAIKAFGEDPEGRPRKILVVVSDGRTKQPRSKREKKFKKVAEQAVEADVKIYTIGFTFDQEDDLAVFEGLSSLTQGVSRRIAKLDVVQDANGQKLYPEMNPADMEEITEKIENLKRELRQQYVITFTPDDYSGAEGKVTLRLEAMAPESKTTVKGKVQGVDIKEKTTPWWVILLWVLGVIVGILFIWLFVKLMIKLSRRKPKEVEYEEDDGPTGPYKGKLTVVGGPMLGSEFYLTEDVTSIGSLDGNDVQISGSGISKRHAGIKIEDMRFEFADFGSTNGTLVNGVKITKQFLRNGDNLQIGDCEIKFSLK